MQTEPQQRNVSRYSDSSGEDDGPADTPPTNGTGGAAKARVRFRYSRGTTGLLHLDVSDDVSPLQMLTVTGTFRSVSVGS